MADTNQRGASRSRRRFRPPISRDPVRDHLPFARAASVIAVVVLAGALFGYDQGVISGALLGIQKAFAVGAVALEIVTSWVTLGAMFGSLAGGYVADHFGRKRALLAAAGLFIAGAAGRGPRAGRRRCSCSAAWWPASASASPRWRPRSTRPSSRRRRSAGGSSRPISSRSRSASSSPISSTRRSRAPGDWRVMLGVSAVRRGSPRARRPDRARVAALARQGRPARRRARDADRARRRGAEADARLAAIEASLRAEHETPSWARGVRAALAHAAEDRPRPRGAPADHRHQRDHLLLRPHLRRGRIHDAGGADRGHDLGDRRASTCSSTFIAIAFIDRFGRRPLLIAGLIGMGLSLAAVGFAFQQSAAAGGEHAALGIVTLAALVVFIVSFAFSLGPVTWTVINEIYPGDVRGRAVAVATAVNWGAAFLVSEFFLSIVKRDRGGHAFWLFAAVLRRRGSSGSIVAVPETRGRSLEEIETSWAARPGGGEQVATVVSGEIARNSGSPLTRDLSSISVFVECASMRQFA